MLELESVATRPTARELWGWDSDAGKALSRIYFRIDSLAYEAEAEIHQLREFHNRSIGQKTRIRRPQ